MFHLREAFSIQEAKVTDKLALLRALKVGISKNKNDWTLEAVRQFPSKVMEVGSRKLYDLHSTKREDRSLKEWCGTVQKSYFEGDSAYVEVRLCDNELGKMLAQELTHNPKEVSVSIDALVRSVREERGKETFNVVEEIALVNSLDFVRSPSIVLAHGIAYESIMEEVDERILNELSFENILIGTSKSNPETEEDWKKIMEIIKNKPKVEDGISFASIFKSMKEGTEPEPKKKIELTAEEIETLSKKSFSDCV